MYSLQLLPSSSSTPAPSLLVLPPSPSLSSSLFSANLAIGQKRTKPDVLQTFFGALKNNTTINTFFCASCAGFSPSFPSCPLLAKTYFCSVPDNIIEDCFSVNRTITQGLGGTELPLLNKFIRTNYVCKKLNASKYFPRFASYLFSQFNRLSFFSLSRLHSTFLALRFFHFQFSRFSRFSRSS